MISKVEFENLLVCEEPGHRPRCFPGEHDRWDRDIGSNLPPISVNSSEGVEFVVKDGDKSCFTRQNMATTDNPMAPSGTPKAICFSDDISS